MSKIKVQDIVGVSRDTFSDAFKNAVAEAQRTLGHVESVEIAPPWIAVLTSDGTLEFRNTVRVLYRSEE